MWRITGERCKGRGMEKKLMEEERRKTGERYKGRGKEKNW